MAKNHPEQDGSIVVSRIQTIRQGQGLSEAQLAQKVCCISAPLLAAIERGETSLSVHQTTHLRDALGVSSVDCFMTKGCPKGSPPICRYDKRSRHCVFNR